MLVVGLTGSLGMGKTTAAAMFADAGVPVFDADHTVHALYAKGGAAVEPIAAAFPDALLDGAIDRVRLGRRVVGDAAAFKRLEAIVHPLVRAHENAFRARAAGEGRRIVVLDIPLLFEAGLDRLCDATVVVTAPPFLQEARVLSRPGMTRERFLRIQAQQMSDAEKRARADFVVATGAGRAHTLNRLREIVRVLQARKRDARNRP
jgi:dephospho-CoA kinase